MKVRRIYAFAVGLASVGVAVAAIGTSSGVAASKCDGQKPIKIGVVMKDYSHPFWVAVKNGAAAEGPKLKCVTLIQTAAGSETDSSGQIAKVQALLAQGINALAIAPIGPELIPVMKQARQKHIPVIVVNGALPGWTGPVVGPDASVSAAGGAKWLIKTLGKKLKNVALITAPYPVVNARLQAMKAVFQKAHIPILGVLNGGQCDEVTAENSVEAFLQAHPNVSAIDAACDPPDVGAIKAIQRAGKKPNKDIYVFGYDGAPIEFQAIKAGTLLGTISQLPTLQGADAVEYAAKAARGQKIPETIVSPWIVVTKSNLAEYQNK